MEVYARHDVFRELAGQLSFLTLRFRSFLILINSCMASLLLNVLQPFCQRTREVSKETFVVALSQSRTNYPCTSRAWCYFLSARQCVNLNNSNSQYRRNPKGSIVVCASLQLVVRYSPCMKRKLVRAMDEYSMNSRF